MHPGSPEADQGQEQGRQDSIQCVCARVLRPGEVDGERYNSGP